VNERHVSTLQRLRSLLHSHWPIRLAVAVALLGLVIWQINLTHLARSFGDAQYGWLIIVTGVYVMSRAVHALEWQITLRKVGRAPYLGLFGALFIGTLVNSVVPANAGDVVKIQLVANRYGLPRAGVLAGRGAEALINAAVMVVFITVSLTLPGIGFGSRNLLWLLAGATALLFVAAVVGSYKAPREFPRWRLVEALPRRLQNALKDSWPRLIDGFEVIRRPQLLVIAIVLNLFGWAVDILILSLYGRAFHLDLPWSAYLSITVVVALLTTFPITFGNIGTYEVALLAILALYGVPSSRALAYAAGTHVFGTIYSVVLGLIAMAVMRIRPSEVFGLRGSRAPAPEGVNVGRDEVAPQDN
jgi:glycosyltransferase 2 family protein